MKIIKKFLIICLCSLLVLNTAYKPIKAEAAEAGIIGGALAAAGVTLTFGHIALIVAAAGGCVYLYQHREEVAESLENYLDQVAENIENGKEELQKWWDRAVLGYITIDTAADFIKDGVKDWLEMQMTDGGIVQGTGEYGLDSYGNVVCVSRSVMPVGTRIPYGIDSGDYVTLQQPCIVMRTYDVDGYDNGQYKFYTRTILLRVGSILCVDGYGTSYGSNVYDYFEKDGEMYNFVSLPQKTYVTVEQSEIDKIQLFKQGMENVPYPSQTLFKNYFVNYSPQKLYPIQNRLDASVVGGLSNVLREHSIDDVKLPDIIIDGTGSICPDTTLTGEDVFADSVADTMAGLASGTMAWSDYIADVGVAAPTITLPDVEDATTTKDYVITDTGVSDVVIDNAATASPDLDKYKIQLRDFFPFCLPFDMVDFIKVLAAEPETPVFDLKFPSINGETLDLQVDLSDWDGVAQLMRNLELLALIIGLCFKTRDIIRG